MAQLVLGAAGAAVGFYLGGPTGAQYGFAAGAALGGYYETVRKKIEGPRLSDLRVTGTEYGECIPYVIGAPRISGQVWWASDKRAVGNTTGGKGGEPQVTTYTYEIDVLIGLTSNEIAGVRRIWSNGKLVWVGTDRPDLWRRMTIYTGDAAQLPDPTYEAAVGVGNAPAYRGRGSVFIEGLQIDGYGQLPNLTFEVGVPLRTTLYEAREFNANQAATTPGGSSETLTISGLSTSDQITVSVVSGAWSRYLGYGTDPGYYTGEVTDPLWQCSFRVKNAAGAETDYLTTAYLTAEEAFAQSAGEIVLTGSTSYSIWLYDDELFNRGSLTLRVDKIDLSTVSTLPLQDVVEDLCDRAGMDAGDIDASALSSITQPVRGIAIAQVEPMRGTLDQLRQAYLFDAALSDKLYFRPRGSASVRTLTYDELGAGFDSAADDPLVISVANDLELPPQIAVQYRNADNDYQVGTEYSDRLISGQVAAVSVQFGLGLTPAEAKKAADVIVTDAHAGIVTAQFSAGIEHTDLEPGDVMQVTDRAGKLLRVRIVRKRDDGGVITFETARDYASVIDSEELTDDGYTEQTTVALMSETDLLPLDIPILRDDDNGPGYYVAARGVTSKWAGAEVRSSVNDVDFSTVATVRESAVHGICSTTLWNAAGGASVIDYINTLTVVVSYGELASSTRSAMFADETINVMAVGSEVIRFITATQSASDPNVYVLSGLFRGCLGTEWAISGHAASETCCLLTTRGMRRVSTQLSDIGTLRYLKGITLGLAASSVTSETFTDTGRALKPWAPVNLRQSKSGSDYTITWTRRTRLKTRFASSAGMSAPLGETSESYAIELLDSGDALVSTFAATSPTVTFSGSYTGYKVRVYQVSEAVGRGYVSATLTLI